MRYYFQEVLEAFVASIAMGAGATMGYQIVTLLIEKFSGA